MRAKENAMKKTAILIVLLITLCFTVVACDSGNDVVIQTALIKKSTMVENSQSAYGNQLISSTQEFCADLTLPSVQMGNDMTNTAISPISIYFALSMLAECANGSTRDEILDVLGVDYATLNANITNLCGGMNKSHINHESDSKEIYSMLSTSNSVWLDKNLTFNEDCLDTLANVYNASSYSVDFENENDLANELIGEYVKEQTHGLIDKDFQISTQTALALINTLYLKDVWNDFGVDCSMTDETVAFIQGNGSVVNKKMLVNDYNVRRKHVGKTFESYYVNTYSGYKIFFLLPNESISASQIMTKANVLEALNANYFGRTAGNTITYKTMCRFPEFRATFDKELDYVLKSLGMQIAFTSSADLTNVLKENAYVETVLHVTDLTVNKKGIEGAAVTIIVNDTISVGPDENTVVYETFDVTRAFGFILTDSNNIPIFSGVVNAI